MVFVQSSPNTLHCFLGVPSLGGSAPTWAVVGGGVGHDKYDDGKEDVVGLTEEIHLKCMHK